MCVHARVYVYVCVCVCAGFNPGGAQRGIFRSKDSSHPHTKQICHSAHYFLNFFKPINVKHVCEVYTHVSSCSFAEKKNVLSRS